MLNLEVNAFTTAIGICLSLFGLLFATSAVLESKGLRQNSTSRKVYTQKCMLWSLHPVYHGVKA